MSAKNAFGYYLLKRAQTHLLSEGNNDAWDLCAAMIDRFLVNGAITSEEQRLVIAINNYQRWEDVPDEQPIGQCIAGGAE